MYLRRRQRLPKIVLLCATLLVCSVAVQCKSLTSFITQASKPSLDLFHRKYAYVQVIDLRNISCEAVTYSENFHGGFGSGSYGGHLHLVCAVCDVTI